MQTKTERKIVFDAVMATFETLPHHVNLSAATRQNGDSNYRKARIDDIPVGTVHYDAHGNLRAKLSDLSHGRYPVTNPSRTPIAADAGTAVYVPIPGPDADPKLKFVLTAQETKTRIDEAWAEYVEESEHEGTDVSMADFADYLAVAGAWAQ